MAGAVNQQSEHAQSRLDFAALTHVTADELTLNAKGKSGTYSMSLVSAGKNGSRMTLSTALMSSLRDPMKIQCVADGEHTLYLGSRIPHANLSFPFSKGVGRNIIYKRALIDYLVRRFQLDFSDKTSMSFKDIEVIRQEYEGAELVVAMVKMVPEE